MLTPQTGKFPFFTVWTAQQLSLVGSHVRPVCPRMVDHRHDRIGPTVLATATFVALLPGVFLSPFAGTLVDRWSRRLVMIVADGFIALVAAWVVVLFWTESIQLWHIYVLMTAQLHRQRLPLAKSCHQPTSSFADGAGGAIASAWPDSTRPWTAPCRISAPALAALFLRFLPNLCCHGHRCGHCSTGDSTAALCRDPAAGTH